MSAERSQLEPSAAAPTRSSRTVARRPRRSWNTWEDQTLRALVAQHSDSRGFNGPWSKIADGIPGRTGKECRKRWHHSLDPSLRKGRWTEDEDQTLRAAYNRLGPLWHEIAALIPGRKDDQCSKRYNEILGPLAQRRLKSWTPQEDEILRNGVSTLGRSWSAISRQLPDRTPLTCRNRYRNLKKQQATPDSSDNNAGTPGEPQMSGAEPAGGSPDDSPPATSPVEMDMQAGVDFQSATGLDFQELDSMMAGGLDVPTDPELFHSHIDSLQPHDNESHAIAPAGHLEAVGHMNHGHGGPGLSIPPTSNAPFRTEGSQLQNTSSLVQPPTSMFPQTSQSAGLVRTSDQNHIDPAPPSIDDATIQAQIRASELAAERDSMAGQPTGHETTHSAPTEQEIDSRALAHSAGNSGVLVHQYHHHHHHHYHYHHHHHHYHHYTF